MKRAGLVVTSACAIVLLPALAGCPDDASSGGFEYLGPNLVLSPKCGSPGDSVTLSGNDESGLLMNTAKFTGGGEAKGTLDNVGKRYELKVTVPPDTVTGPVSWFRQNKEDYDMGTFTVPCPEGSDSGIPSGDAGDAGKDSGPPVVTGPTCGVVVTRGSAGAAASTFSGTLMFVPATSADGEAKTNAYADATAKPIAVGECGSPPTLVDPADAIDLQGTPSIQNGSTKLTDLTKDSANIYRGFGGTLPLPYGILLALLVPGLVVTPANGSAGTFPNEVIITSPVLSDTPVIVTKGQPFTVTWTPPAAGSVTALYLRFSADNKICAFDPAAGTGTVPGTFTSTLSSGQYGLSVLFTREDKHAVTVAGTACALRSITAATKSGQINVQ